MPQIPSEGRRAEDFFDLKNPTASAGFEPANMDTKGQHATPRPPKPLANFVESQIFWDVYCYLPTCRVRVLPLKLWC